jgi:hypothetical protein
MADNASTSAGTSVCIRKPHRGDDGGGTEVELAWWVGGSSSGSTRILRYY